MYELRRNSSHLLFEYMTEGNVIHAGCYEYVLTTRAHCTSTICTLATAHVATLYMSHFQTVKGEK